MNLQSGKLCAPQSVKLLTLPRAAVAKRQIYGTMNLRRRELLTRQIRYAPALKICRVAELRISWCDRQVENLQCVELSTLKIEKVGNGLV